MGVEQRRRTKTSRALLVAAAVAPTLDIVGRLLAPSQVFARPALIVLMSPTDAHVLLTDTSLRSAMLALAFTARTVRACLVYEAFRDRPWRATGRVVGRVVDRARHSRAGAVFAVVVLPGMPAGLVAAQVQLRRRLFLPALVISNLAGTAFTMTIGFVLAPQLADLAATVSRHRLASSAVAALLVTVGVAKRAVRARHRTVARCGIDDATSLDGVPPLTIP
jgi:hypothetical protein